MSDFASRTLLLTGANGGIGREVARLFHAGGANLVLTDLDADSLAGFAQTLGDPDRIATLHMDAASPDDSARAVATAVERFGGIDFLVPSAGLYQAQPVASMTDDQWRQTLGINLDGVFYLVRRAMTALREDSAIVNLTSVAAHRGAYSNAHYAASKGALLSLTRSLARELGPRTRVNAVSPGIIETPMTTELVRTRGAESVEQTPLRRLGHPREVASAIAFLCSGAASFITGEVLHVNGGLYMAG
ncbi:SDR family NAD(P)-dependent oxidoreductase [Cupriavidus oxalaticus]|uniref:SDR family oxidoreductase n=1 Tax=Cupriavidus oxalaticus TaxID=96344 RepID=A0A4P7LSV8_9BURK|nr:SDR family oxidoreductase [Cupriavidus oxalaticus]QBY55581.1 SDR family oxidoreductase [Cupriavidus oxalaticus]